jgi:hypothetical protein
VVGAEVEHGSGQKTEGAGAETPACYGSAVVGLAGGLLRTGCHDSAAHDRASLLGRRIGILVGLAQTVPAR